LANNTLRPRQEKKISWSWKKIGKKLTF
jgi:hypothetical protein